MKKLRVLIGISCILLGVLLIYGGVFCIAISARRAERLEYYDTPIDVVDIEDADKWYYLRVEHPESMYLLHKAANTSALHYEIAAEWIREYSEESIDYLWLPYELDREDYFEKILPQVKRLYVPEMMPGYGSYYEYSDLTVRKEPERPSGLEYEVGLTVNYRRNSGARSNQTRIGYTRPGYGWRDFSWEPGGFTHYETLLTADGYEVVYYTSGRLEDRVEAGNSWGEVYVGEAQPMTVNVTRYDYLRKWDSMKALKESTMINYVEYLENDDGLREAAADGWRAVTRICFGILMYLTALSFLLVLTVALVVRSALVTPTHRDRRRDMIGQKSSIWKTGLCISVCILLILGSVVGVFGYRWHCKREEIHAQNIQRNENSDYGGINNQYIALMHPQLVYILNRAAHMDPLMFDLAVTRIQELLQSQHMGYINAMERDVFLEKITPLLEQMYVPVIDETADTTIQVYRVTIPEDPKAVGVSKNPQSGEYIRVSLGIFDRSDNSYLGLPDIVWLYTPDYYQKIFEIVGDQYVLYADFMTQDGHLVEYYTWDHLDYLKYGSSWGNIHINEEFVLDIGFFLDGQPLYSLQDCRMVTLEEYLNTSEDVWPLAEKEWNALKLQHDLVLVTAVVLVMDVVMMIVCGVMFLVRRRVRE